MNCLNVLMSAGMLLMLATVMNSPAAAQGPLPYGPNVTLAQARVAVKAAEEEAIKNSWNVVITVVDTGGNIVLLQRLDQTQFASIEIARQKAVCAAGFRRSTKVFEEGVAKGGEGLKVLKLPGGLPIEGGIPLVVDGKIVGAIGVSGVTSQQDGVIAQTGVDALKK